MVNIFIGALIMLLPLFNRFAAHDFSRTSRDNLFALLIIFFLFIMPNRKRALGITTKAVGAMLLLMVALNHWYVMSVNVMFHAFYIASGMSFLLAYAERVEHDDKAILSGMVMGSLIQSLMGMLDAAGVRAYSGLITHMFSDVVAKVDSSLVVGSLGNPNITACYLVLTMPAFFAFRAWYLVFFPVATLCLIGSAISSLALVGGVIYFLNERLGIVKTSWLYIASTVPMVFFYFFGMAGLDSHRLYTWQQNIERLKDSPWIGYGPGWFADAKFMQDTDGSLGAVMVQEHNEFLASLNTFGLIGTLLIAMVFYRCKKPPVIWGSVLYIGFLNAYGHFSLHVSTTAIILLVAGAVCLSGGKDVVNMER